MQNKIVGLIRRTQEAALFGLPGALERAHTPYDPGFYREPYDLGAPDAVAEVKRALVALAAAGANPAGGGDVVTETTWQSITDGDTWDLAAGTEYLLFLSRFGRALADKVLVQDPVAPGSSPQPTVTGLECLAATVNTVLQGQPKLAIYEQWRGGLFKPPSWVSAPPEDTPVMRTANVAPVDGAIPPDAPAALRADVEKVDYARFQIHRAMPTATTEAQRAIFAKQAAELDAARAASLLAAKTGSPSVVQSCGPQEWWNPATGKCEMMAAPPPAAQSGGNAGLWIVAGIGVVLLGGVAYAAAQRKR